LRVCLLLVVILSISRVHEHFSFMTRARPVLLLVLAAAAYAFLRPRLVGREWVRTWPPRVIVGLAIVACLSVPFGISLGGSASFFLFTYSKVLITAILVMAAIRGARDLSAFIWAYVVSCGLLVWMSTVVFPLTIYRGGLARLEDLYMYDSNDLGVVLMIGIALAALTFQTSGRIGKLVSAVTLLGIGVAIARSGSRGAFVGLVAVGLAFLFGLKHVSAGKRVAFLAATCLAVVIAAPQGYWDQMRTMLNPTQDYNWLSETGRKAVTERGIGYMLRYPLFGVGIDNFGRAEGTISERAQNRRPGGPGIRWTAPHNSFLQAGAELGIPGLLLWSSLVFGGIISMRRMHRRLPRAWARGDPEERLLYFSTVYLPVALIGFGATAFFVSFAWLEPIYFLAALVTGVYVSVRERQRTLNGLPHTSTASCNPRTEPARRDSC
jgi:O-antigen ligase